MTAKAKSLFGAWTLKDFILLASLLGYAIHGESKSVDVGKSAESAVTHGVEHFEAQLATLAEHQKGVDLTLFDHEGRIRVLERPQRPLSVNP